MATIKDFGSVQNQPVRLIRLENGPCACEILTYGAAVRSLTVPNRRGELRDVVLGFDTIEDYANHTCYFGAIIGPVANRIGGASCPLGDGRLTLTKNDGENSNHSGIAGLNARLWTLEEATDRAVTLACTHPDGFGGIPGDLRVRVTYTLERDRLRIDYWAETDRLTLCNLTNHCYFNLDGHAAGDVLDHRVQIFAHSFTPNDAHSVPIGSIRALAGSALDLSRPVRIRDRIDAADEQLQNARGFDQNWVIDPGDQAAGLHPAALVRSADGSLGLEVWTDRPCVQFYTGNYIPAGMTGKDGAVYGPRQGLCLETQAYPDAPNQPGFPAITLAPGRTWTSRTEYRFTVSRDADKRTCPTE